MRRREHRSCRSSRTRLVEEKAGPSREEDVPVAFRRGEMNLQKPDSRRLFAHVLQRLGQVIDHRSSLRRHLLPKRNNGVHRGPIRVSFREKMNQLSGLDVWQRHPVKDLRHPEACNRGLHQCLTVGEDEYR
jgi:hypothetical protein